MTQIHERDDSERLREAVAAAVANRQSVAICGRGSKAFLGPVGAGNMLGTADHCGGIDYRPDELVITARAGTPLADIRRLLATQSQMLPFDPPMFRGDGSLGGAVAAGLSGPQRPWFGSVRDAVLGVRLINGHAQVLDFGGQVMKNDAGYDVARLMTGAFGTLGVLLHISIKVLPQPACETTLAFELDRDSALARVVAWARESVPLSATCHVDDTLHVRLSGTQLGVSSAARALGGTVVPHAEAFWDALRDHALPFFADAQCWRIALPAAAPFPALAGRWLIEWAGGLRWLNSAAPADAVRAAVAAAGGFATPFHRVAQAPRVEAPLAKYYQRIKAAFDPHDVFNRGRLWADV
jgi:glycolate oxidase FAD binding subunit